MEMKEVLQLLKDYEQKLGLYLVRIEMYSDESGAVRDGFGDDELIAFISLDELIDGLKNFKNAFVAE